MLVAAVDAGNPRNMGWAFASGLCGCGEASALIDRIADELASGGRVALGIEAPLWFVRGRSYPEMTMARGPIEREMRRAWSAGAGCGALAAGLANLGWIMDELLARLGPLRVTTQIDHTDSAQLFIWEAFVSGVGKGKRGGHAADALIAANAFKGQWPTLKNVIPAEYAVNLACATILAAGHSIAPSEIGHPVVVIAP